MLHADKEALARITAQRNAGMSIVTTRATDGTMAGCLVGFLTQCSMEPVRWLACLSNLNYTFRVAAHAESLAIHFLEKGDMQLAELFGGSTGDDTDKFKLCAWESGPRGVPILQVCKRWVVGRIFDRLDLGDHMGYLIDSEYAASPEGGWQILYMSECHEISPGHPR